MLAKTEGNRRKEATENEMVAEGHHFTQWTWFK